MKSKIIKIIAMLIILFLIQFKFSSITKAGNFDYNPNITYYECRVGDQYFQTLEQFFSNQWVVQSLSDPVVEILQPEIDFDGINNIYVGKIKFTTGSDTGVYPYQGEPGTTAKITRSTASASQPLFLFSQMKGVYSFENIIIDGGWKEDHTGIEAGGPLIKMSGDGMNVTLGNNAILQNNKSSDNGGAIHISGSTNIKLSAENGSVIRNCAATSGGAIAIDANAVGMEFVTDGLTIRNCYATSATVKNASAIEIYGTSDVQFMCYGIDIQECAAINATEDGAALGMQTGTINFLEGGSSTMGVTIKNNYSASTLAGISQYINNNVINIEKDIIIDDNYANCTFENYELVTKGENEANLYVTNPENININTNITENTSVGVIVKDADFTQTVVFGNADSTITGLKNFFSDETDLVGINGENNTAIFGQGAVTPPEVQEYATLNLIHMVNGNFADTNKKYKYQITYIKDGETFVDNIELSHQESYTVEIDIGTNYLIKLNESQTKNFDIETNMPQENTEAPTVDDSLKTVTGTIDVKAEGTVIYTYSKEIAPSTGIEENINLLLIVPILGLILCLINRKLNREYEI